MIEKLTKEQQAQLAVYRDKWIMLGLRTGPVDLEAAKQGIELAYSRAGLSLPSLFIVLDSPFQGSVAKILLSHRSVGDQVSGQVEEQVWGQVWGQVRSQVWGQVWGQVANQVSGQIRSQVSGQVEEQVWGQVADQVEEQVSGQIRSQDHFSIDKEVIIKVLQQACLGNQDTWLSFYNFFQECYNMQLNLDGLVQAAYSCGWWWPMRGAVILTHRPVRISLDDDSRLHHETQAAVKYSDGFGVWAWHGVRVPKDLIEAPEKFTPERIQQETNQEIRRVMIERYGLPKWLRDSKARELHRDSCGVLVELAMDDDRDHLPAKFVLVKDASTDREYALRVDPQTQTAKGGVASTWGLTEKEYHPLIET